MTICHSCCPEKRDIRAPEFIKGAGYLLPKGVMQEWTCSGCRTVIYTFEPSLSSVAVETPNILGQ